MYITNFTNVHDKITSNNYDQLTLCNCTSNDNIDTKIEIVISLFTIIPCGMSLICLISLMVYTLMKPLLSKL